MIRVSFRAQVVVAMSDAPTSVPDLSRFRCLSSVIHIGEAIDSDSYVGREVARRIVAKCAGFVREEADDDLPDVGDVLSFFSVNLAA